ncbi:ABC transporter permease [Candidatus Kaiserbacteria bacterium RIFCSPLOWO2_01_FULL_52_12b]|uniref:Transport permease protein n=1 Tax=Candidatus Kaiserbacteria bacterium RIFCSPLOWO2_01_FULL_52_12b TaxID=1798509 RepID=A0A1F6EXX8_9BACT|nr:MAG: ABC transporter permease [Candidatus Kaiserbacteria bacterium RIFCSPLOWO2_01_FULL_52_12b]
MTPYQTWISFYTIVRKDVLRMFRIWAQTFLPSVVTSILYFLVFGAFLGSKIGEIQGVPYVMFVVPGLVMLAVITNSYANTSFVMFSAKFFGRNIDEILVSPTPPWVLVGGYITGGIIRGVLIGALVLLVSLFFTHLTIHSLFVIIVFLILTSLVFALAGLVNGVYAKTIDGINIIPTFVLTPLVYLGGVFYSTQALPEFWSTLTKFDPVFYIINGFRYGFLGTSDVSIFLSVGLLVFFALILLCIAWYLIKTGLGLKQ